MTAGPLSMHDDTPHEDHTVILRGVDSGLYEGLLESRGDKFAPRLTYLEGVLEIMRPSKDHERINTLIARLVEAWCDEQGIDLMAYGSWTLKDKPTESGAEPDACYVFGTEDRDRPHLAIEVEWTRRRLDKLEVCRNLGVAEVWCWRRGTIEVHLLHGPEYVRATRSQLLPDLDLVLLATFLDRGSIIRAVREFRAAVRAAKS